MTCGLECVEDGVDDWGWPWDVPCDWNVDWAPVCWDSEEYLADGFSRLCLLSSPGIKLTSS